MISIDHDNEQLQKEKLNVGTSLMLIAQFASMSQKRNVSLTWGGGGALLSERRDGLKNATGIRDSKILGPGNRDKPLLGKRDRQ